MSRKSAKRAATQARKAPGPQARYDAAGMGRRMSGWQPPASGPNRAIVGLQKVRDRSRDVTRNDWSGKAALQKWTTNLIGVGIVPRVRSTVKKDLKKRLIKLWDKWVKSADADGVLNFYGLQTLAVRAWLESGEVFVRLRDRAAEAGLEVPLQVQLIEAEFVPMLDADNWPGMPAGNTIRCGIERNKYGRRVAYWMYREHPGDLPTSLDASKLMRILADEVCHIFEPERPGQLRGVSMLVSVLTRLRNVNDYDDAVLDRQKLANLLTMFITRPANTSGYEDIDPLTGQKINVDDGGPVAVMRPGMSMALEPGEDVKFNNPPEAGTTYSDYMRTQHMGTAAGSGLPYELFSGDILNISDRTLRVIINEFRRLAEQRQWQIVIPMFCERVRGAWARQAAVAGVIDETEVEDAADAEWSPHGWQYIHPVQDAQGKKLEVDAGFRSRSSVISERGDDPEAVDDERHSDIAREKALDLVPVVVAPDPSQVATKKAEKQQKADKKAAQALEIATITAHGAGPTPAPIFAPVVNIAAPEPAPAPIFAPVTNFAAPLPAPAPIFAPVVNIAAPEPAPAPIFAPVVNVDVPTPIVNVDVQPAAVEVTLPDRRTESAVTRDLKGNITKVIQTETTIETGDSK